MINILSLNNLKRLSITATALIFVFIFNFSSAVSADLSASQTAAFSEGAAYFDVSDGGSCSTSSSGGGSNTAVSGPGAWNSNTMPPYYLESFVINVLEDVAQIENVPTTDTVTQEHVVALVAWGWEEGGNIANTDIFNIWNTGIDDPSLLSGTPSGNGVQSFRSFDAGVTAAADTMTGSNQNRIAQALINPSTTAEQFMQTLTYFQNYPGNHYWAQAGDIPTQQAYINALDGALSGTRANYSNRASTVIGPGEEDTDHVPASQLKYQGGTSNATASASTGGSACGSAASASANCNSSGTQVTGNAAIACDVLQYDTLSYNQGWHSSGSVFHSRCPTIGPQCATDCSGLVNIAIYDVFKNDINDNTYGEVADKTNFKEISASDLKPGDFIQPAAESGDHVVIVESINGNTAQTFAANTDGVAQPDQVGPNPLTLSSGDIYLRYIGQGATYQ